MKNIENAVMGVLFGEEEPAKPAKAKIATNRKGDKAGASGLIKPLKARTCIKKLKIDANDMSVYDACACVEGFDGLEHTEEEELAAWQVLIDTGACWKLQGWYGRNAHALIKAGLCRPAKA